MKPRNIAIVCGVAGTAVGIAIAAGIVYHKQIKSATSLKRLTGYADGHDLYAIDIAYDYDLDRIISAGVRDDQAHIDAVVAQVLPGVPAHVQAPQFACSAFAAVDAEGACAPVAITTLRTTPRRCWCAITRATAMLHRLCGSQ